MSIGRHIQFILSAHREWGEEMAKLRQTCPECGSGKVLDLEDASATWDPESAEFDDIESALADGFTWRCMSCGYVW